MKYAIITTLVALGLVGCQSNDKSTTTSLVQTEIINTVDQNRAVKQDSTTVVSFYNIDDETEQRTSSQFTSAVELTEPQTKEANLNQTELVASPDGDETVYELPDGIMVELKQGKLQTEEKYETIELNDMQLIHYNNYGLITVGSALNGLPSGKVNYKGTIVNNWTKGFHRGTVEMDVNFDDNRITRFDGKIKFESEDEIRPETIRIETGQKIVINPEDGTFEGNITGIEDDVLDLLGRFHGDDASGATGAFSRQNLIGGFMVEKSAE